jgi:tetratricopeptide (TPR) repeat protein
MYAATLKDPETVKSTRKRGRDLCAKAKKLGSGDYMVRYLLETMSEDGARGKFSDNETIELALKDGEAAWVKGDLESAKAAYLRAHLLDPSNYEAALFIGDVYFREKQWGSACEWFSQATKIDPDRETAYRYWADALFMMKKTKEAREKFIEAFITAPFTTATSSALVRFGERMQLTLAHPKIESPNSMKADPAKPNSINITIDSESLQAKDGTSNWMLYEISRAAWRTDEVRKKKLPNEKEYRHSMMEEVEALNMVAAEVESQLKAKKIKQLDRSLQVLLRLKNEGLLEAYVLLARTDEGIAQDYAAYLRDHRENLRRYVSQYVVPEISDTAAH